MNLSDVSETDWFYGQVATALGAGYITGYEDNTMRPGKRLNGRKSPLSAAAGAEFEESGRQDFWMKAT